MKFIKVFENDAAYAAYRDSGNGYIRPNVSLSRNTKKVFYNNPIWEANGHDYVDLGLPSGTLWATMNVGASNPSDRGLYFQWGDTVGYTASEVGTGSGQKKFSSDWSDYKWYLSGSGVDPKFKKYTTTGATLELEDDAAHANMGGDWHMRSPAQIQELIDNTTSAWTTLNSVSCIKFTSTKDTSKFIFIPAVGKAFDGSVYNAHYGYVWSSMLVGGAPDGGQELYFSSGYANLYYDSRSYGLSVRGVLG